MSNQRQSSERPSHNYAFAVKRPSLKQQIRSALDGQYKSPLIPNAGVLFDRQSEAKQTYFIKHLKAYYEGQWKDSLPNGRGFAIYSDGSYLEGNFVQGQVQDHQGLLILSNGAVYRGNISNSVISGKGIMNHLQYSYDGSWANGKPEGKGIEKYDGYRSYNGLFKGGVKHGKGIYIDNDLREQYHGQFQNGFMDGQGEYKVDGKVVYIGQFEKGNKVGEGILTTEKGKLKGFFKNDVVNGPGSFEWSDGRVYRGDFVNSKFEGEGKIILMNGNVLSGSWKDGHSDKLTLVPHER